MFMMVHGYLLWPTWHGCTKHWNTIFTSLVGRNRWLNFLNDADFFNACARVLEIQLIHKYLCECKQTVYKHKWQTWQVSFQWHRRGNELVFKSLPVLRQIYVGVTWKPSGYRLFLSATILAAMCIFVWNFTWHYKEDLFWCVVGWGFTLIWWGSSQLQCSYWSRQPRVFQHLT